MSLPVTPELVETRMSSCMMSRSDLAVEQPAHGLHARPALLVGGELGLDGVQLDQLGVLHVLIGVVGADHIGAVLLVDALQRGVHHAQIAVTDLDAADARGHAADGDAQPRRDEIGGEHEHGHDRERLCAGWRRAAVPRGAREGPLVLLGRAHAIPALPGTSCASNVTEMLLRAGTARPKSKLAARL